MVRQDPVRLAALAFGPKRFIARFMQGPARWPGAIFLHWRIAFFQLARAELHRRGFGRAGVTNSRIGEAAAALDVPAINAGAASASAAHAPVHPDPPATQPSPIGSPPP